MQKNGVNPELIREGMKEKATYAEKLMIMHRLIGLSRGFINQAYPDF